jgi:hypothetical protein
MGAALDRLHEINLKAAKVDLAASAARSFGFANVSHWEGNFFSRVSSGQDQQERTFGFPAATV